MLKKRYNIKIVNFEDDVFGTKKKWLIEFCAKYKAEINLPFMILTHPKFMDDESARLLADAGCKWIQMGIQSMDDDFKKETLLRYEKSDDIDNALRVMHKYGINVKVDHMFGLPNEPISAQETALKLYANNHINRIQTFYTCFLPGTQLMKEAIEDGTLNSEQINNINEGKEFHFFRNTENIKDPNVQNLYQCYEFIFKIIPLLPLFIKKRIKPKHVSWMPLILKAFIIFIADIVNGIKSNNPDHWAYIYHNLFQLSNYCLNKITKVDLKASKIKQDECVIEYFNEFTALSKQNVLPKHIVLSEVKV
jgi:hypothetical protein